MKKDRRNTTANMFKIIVRSELQLKNLEDWPTYIISKVWIEWIK